MKEKFVERRFSKSSQGLISQANMILQEYEPQGLVLTLRQLYYQFVARGLIPNKQSEYKRLGSVISDARLAGLIDWAMMEDRTRRVLSTSVWDSPSHIMAAVADQYAEDLWRGQRYRPEVWIEKTALIGVVERACQQLRVPYFACIGYASQTSLYEAGQRLKGYREAGQVPVVFHFGDHDPSGIDMTRDNGDRIALFAGHGVDVRRLALTWQQIEEHSPPPNPAKESDTRAADYISKFGADSWELDALEPTIIDGLIRTNINELVVKDAWREAAAREDEGRGKLAAIAAEWDEP